MKACVCVPSSGYGAVFNIFQLGPNVYDIVQAKVKPLGMQSLRNGYL